MGEGFEEWAVCRDGKEAVNSGRRRHHLRKGGGREGKRDQGRLLSLSSALELISLTASNIQIRPVSCPFLGHPTTNNSSIHFHPIVKSWRAGTEDIEIL